MIFMPFSPRWLIHHGREEEARRVLSELRELDERHELVELEFLEIKAQSLFEKRTVAELFPALREQTAWNVFKLQFVSIRKLFETRAMFRRVIVATVTMFFQQWTGINAVLYYAPFIFKQLGLGDTETSLLATGVVGIVMFVATIPSVLWIDRAGRKPVLTIGAVGMATCHIVIAVIVAKNIDRWHEQVAAGWAAVCMVWLFVVHFGYSWGPCSWIIIAEIWPLSTRPYGVSLGASSNWMNNFIVGQVTPDMLDGITYGTYILFGLLTYMGAAFIWFFVPETKRLTLEEMVSFFFFLFFPVITPSSWTQERKKKTGQLTEKTTGRRLWIRGYSTGRLRAHGGDQCRDWPDADAARRICPERIGCREEQGWRSHRQGVRRAGSREDRGWVWEPGGVHIFVG